MNRKRKAWSQYMPRKSGPNVIIGEKNLEVVVYLQIINQTRNEKE